MKTKYSIISLLLSFFCLTMQAQIDQTQTISVTTAYVDNVSMTWYVNGTVTNKPLLVNYNIGTEYRCDYVKIYSIDSGGAETLLVSLSGIQSGSISSVIPTGKVKITFTSDGSISYQTNSSLFSGVQVSFSTDNNSYPSNTFANSYISGNSIVNGNVGIGVLNPSYKLEVNGTAKFLENVQCGSSISFQDDARFNVTTATIPNLRTPSFSMSRYGIAAPGVAGTADLWIAGDNAIRMFTAGNATPIMNILSSGYVGIGTIAPLRKLVVQGPDDGTPQIRVQGTADQTSYWEFGRESYSSGDFFITNNRQGTIAKRLTIQDTSGNVAIGNQTPASKLDVDGEITMSYGSRIGTLLYDKFTYPDNNSTMGHYSLGWFTDPWNTNAGTLWVSGCGGMKFFTGGSPRLAIDGSGRVGIGTTIPDHELTVNGTIHAKEIIVTVDIPADYVFKPNYQLMPLSQVEQYVKTNSHLPEIPSAGEITKNGVNVGEMQNKLLQKIEELTLYVIEQQRTNNQQSAKIEELERKLK